MKGFTRAARLGLGKPLSSRAETELPYFSSTATSGHVKPSQHWSPAGPCSLHTAQISGRCSPTQPELTANPVRAGGWHRVTPVPRHALGCKSRHSSAGPPRPGGSEPPSTASSTHRARGEWHSEKGKQSCEYRNKATNSSLIEACGATGDVILGSQARAEQGN